MTTPFITDNRWSAGSSGHAIPQGSPAAYAARWIDQGDRVDVVPDRQGFAYDDVADRDALLDAMGQANLREQATTLGRDVPTVVVVPSDYGFTCCMRRSGGYIYVDAWLVAS